MSYSLITLPEAISTGNIRAFYKAGKPASGLLDPGAGTCVRIFPFRWHSRPVTIERLGHALGRVLDSHCSESPINGYFRAGHEARRVGKKP